MSEYHPNYVIGPFKFLVEVNFPDPITKLDFVNNRYQVRGKKQLLADVVYDGTGETFHVWTDGTQLQKDSVGLDLRGRKNGVRPGITGDFEGQVGYTQWTGAEPIDLTWPPMTVRLKNKAVIPTKENPGALNEFTFLDYTIVMEFDWFDRKVVMENEGGYEPDSWDQIETFFGSKADSPGNFVDPAKTFAVQQVKTSGEERYPDEREGDPFFFSGEVLINPETGLPITDKGTEGEGFGSGGNPYTERKINAFDVVPVSSPVAGGPYRITPPGKYSDTGAAAIINGTAIVQGRNRVAVSVTKNRIAMAVNGGKPTVLFAPPKFPMPRVARSGTGKSAYFATEGGDNQHPQVTLSGSAVWRCVWLYRKPKKDKQLKKMSVIRDLPDADDSGWARKGAGL